MAGYLNAVTTLFTIYLLPTLTNLKMKHTEIKNPILVEAIKQNEYTYQKKDTNFAMSPKLKLDREFVKKNLGKI